jgi:hypothetical protein
MAGGARKYVVLLFYVVPEEIHVLYQVLGDGFGEKHN